jgi:hypothetical protein
MIPPPIEKRRAAKSKKPGSTWSYSNGVLVVDHDGRTVVIGTFETRQLAAKAAAEYFARHGGQQP